MAEKQERVAWRELDAEIAERVMGWTMFPYLLAAASSGIKRRVGESTICVYHCPPGEVHVSTIRRVPDYSRDIAAAFAVVEAMGKKGWAYCRVQSFIADYGESTQRVEWWAEFDHDHANDNEASSPHCATPALAICLASLEALRDKWASPNSVGENPGSEGGPT